MPNSFNSSPQEKSAIIQSNIADILQKQNQLLEKIYIETKKTRRYIAFGRVVSFIYLLLLLVPIVFAIFYLPPLIKNLAAPYAELLDVKQGAENLDANALNGFLKQLGR